LPSASFSARDSFLFLVIRAAKHLFTSVDQKIDMYKQKFKHLSEAFQGYAVLQTEIMVTRILDITTESSKFGFVTRTVSAGLMFRHLVVSALELNDLPYADGVRFSGTPRCLPGTRQGILKTIRLALIGAGEEKSPCYC
jgi:hypothetical protein